jgi:hypothetical protein
MGTHKIIQAGERLAVVEVIVGYAVVGGQSEPFAEAFDVLLFHGLIMRRDGIGKLAGIGSSKEHGVRSLAARGIFPSAVPVDGAPQIPKVKWSVCHP